jgi:DNA-binding beta-propeller fold protein YncE
MNNKLVAIALLTASLTACNSTDPQPDQPYDKGVLVLNAGNFSDNNGTISLLSRSDKTIATDIFMKENSRSLAGGVQGYAEVNEKGLILVDNSTAGKDVVEIVNARTFKAIATIPSSEIENPRVVVKVSDTKAYISCWDATGDFLNFYKNSGYVAVIDLTTNKLTKKISVQNGAETIIVVGSEAFVGCTGAGKTTLSVIDIATDAIKQSIEIGKNPSLLGIDANGKLWIYTGAELLRFNTSTKAIEARLKVTSPNASASPSAFTLSADKRTFYFTSSFYDAADGYKQKGQTYSFSIDATSVLADKPFINRLFGGGLGVDAQTGTIYAGLVPSYKQAGYVFRYQPNGTLIDSVKAEIAPSQFFFKK